MGIGVDKHLISVESVAGTPGYSVAPGSIDAVGVCSISRQPVHLHMPVKLHGCRYLDNLRGRRVNGALEQQQFNFSGVLREEGEINSISSNGRAKRVRSASAGLKHK